VILLAIAAGCRPEGATGDVVDSTFIATMAELQQLQVDPALDSAAREAARRYILQRRGLTPEGLYQAARALAEDEEHALRVWRAIDSVARADTSRRR
jgi:hypothetical protein